MKVISIVGARPQFIKLAPLIKVLTGSRNRLMGKDIDHRIIHTGQHYDYQMNKLFFKQLGIPEPVHNLEVGSGTHGDQTGEMLKRIEKVLFEEGPDMILVYGDTNSTLAGALSAAKIHIPVGHVEAGLRSYNKAMPEEVNRVLTDHCAEVLFCPTENACRNLRKEGQSNLVNDGKLISVDAEEMNATEHAFPLVVNVGDIMYDILLMGMKISEGKSSVMDNLFLKPKQYFLATVHRAENTDNPARMMEIMAALNIIGEEFPVIFPAHPRTQKVLALLKDKMPPHKGVRLMVPVGYFDMLQLEKNARKIITDSGGIQKEAYFLKVPCVTLRDETEWVETLEGGYNVLAGAESDKIVESVLKPPRLQKQEEFPEYYGDGKTGERILTVIQLLMPV